MLDSASTPNAEFTVKDNKVHIELLDANRKTIPLDKQSLNLTAGTRAKSVKLDAGKEGNKFVAGPLPEGKDYYIIFQLKEKKIGKKLTFRVRYDARDCESCDKQEWLCTCGNEGTGKDIAVPSDIKGLWAELNQHHAELKEGYKEKEYEALDEVTDAFPILAAALPSKSKDLSAEQQKAVADGSTAVVDALKKIKAANSARKLKDAKKSVADVAGAIAALKRNYPAATANAKL